MAEDFLCYLVDETMKLQKSGEAQLSSLEHKLNDYGLKFLKGEFIPQVHMLNFKTPFGMLDVPMTWALFENDHTLLNRDNDSEHFFSVVQSKWDRSFENMLIVHADGFCYIVGMKIGEDCYLHDLLNPQECLKDSKAA